MAKDKDVVFDLGKKKKAVVSSFKGKTLIHIREYYTNDEGEEMPGKKGISLTVDVFNNLLEVLPRIQDAINDRDDDKKHKVEEGDEEKTEKRQKIEE